jgi:hypothetical protein
LEIAFSTRSLRSLSESQTLASRKLGKQVAVAFHARLADCLAAQNVEELPLGFCASHTSRVQFTMSLTDGFVVVFQTNHRRDKEAQVGTAVDWKRVSRIKLLEVVKK